MENRSSAVILAPNWPPLATHGPFGTAHGGAAERDDGGAMADHLFTDRTVRSLRTEEVREDFVDTNFAHGEFGIRVSCNGAKRFFLRYRVNGKRRRLILGQYPGLSLSDAREKAVQYLAQIIEGADPQREKCERKAADSVGGIFELYIRHKAGQIAQSTLRDFRSMYRREVEPAIGDMKAVDVKKRDIIAILNRIAHERGKGVMSNRVRELINAMFNYAVAQDLIEYNPATGVKKAGQERPGERYLSRDEIRLYWAHTEEEPPDERAFFRLLLLLALRPGEVMKLKWEYLDGRVLTLPAEIVKNNRRHELYICDLAQDELSMLSPAYREAEYLFPGHLKGTHRTSFREGHLRLLLAMNDGKMKRENWHVPLWTLRDIRRTCETQMRRVISDGEAVSRVLNHDVSAIRKHYDKNTYFDKKKLALLKWEAWLKSVIAEDPRGKVVNLYD